MSMNGEQRRAFIRRQLHGAAGVSTAELQETLGVSMMTVWRDLGALEREGALRRVHGGAVPVDGAAGPEPSFAAKAARAASAKQRIARVALAGHVRPGMTLALDGGSTVAALMPFLPVNSGLTLLTNSLEIVRQTPAGVAVSCSGGIYREVSGTFVGPQALRFFSEHRADVAFVSATGLDEEEGLTDPNPLEIEVKRALCARAGKVVLLIDAQKFGKRSTLPVLGLAALAEVVCDARPPRGLAAALKAARVEVCLA